MARKKNKNKRQAALAGILAIQTAPVVVRQSRSGNAWTQFLEDEKAAEKAKNDALLAPIIENTRLLYKEKSDLQKRFWAQDKWTTVSSSTVAQLKSLSDFAVDSDLQVADGKCTSEAAQAAAAEWEVTQEARLGIVLHPTGGFRTLNYGVAQMMFGGKDMSTVAAWDAACARLQEIGAYAEGEYAQDDSYITVAKPVAEVPEVKQSFDELIEQTNLDTRSGKKLILDAADDFYFQGEARQRWSEWTQHLATVHNFTLTDSVARQCWNWFRTSNQSFTDYSAYDRCRKAVLGIKTPEEIECDRIENSVTTSNLSHTEKRQLNKTLAQYRKPEDPI